MDQGRRGDVPGRSARTDRRHRRAAEPLTDLGTLGGDSASAYGINAAGTIVGRSQTSGGDDHAFSYDPATHTMTDLGTLPGGSDSRAYGINNAGTIVGSSDTVGSHFHAFSYDPATHTMTDLGTLPGGDYSRAYGINDAGTIVGYSSTTGGPTTVCSATTPQPTP